MRICATIAPQYAEVLKVNVKNKKSLWGLDVVFSDAYPPIARWAETGGRGIHLGNPSPTSIRNDTRFSKKNQVDITTLA